MMFAPGLRPHGSAEFGSTIFNPGNEPSFTTPYLFNFVGRQDLSVKFSRAAADAYYQPTPQGLPGNSDAGAMESWLLWSMIGLYPVTGQTTFLIGSPWLNDLTLDLGSGKTLHITSTTAGGNSTSQPIYVQSLELNGRPWNQSWVAYDDIFANGGNLSFVLGSKPSKWSASGTPPPSPASELSVPPPLTLPIIVDGPDLRRGWLVARPVVATLVSAVGTSAVLSFIYFYTYKRRPQSTNAQYIPNTEILSPLAPRQSQTAAWSVDSFKKVLCSPLEAFSWLGRILLGKKQAERPAGYSGSWAAATTAASAAAAAANTLKPATEEDVAKSFDSSRYSRRVDDADKNGVQISVAAVSVSSFQTGSDAV